LKTLRNVITAAIIMLPALATAQDVKIDYDKKFNFAPVKTYAIALGTKWGNDLSERRVLAEIDEAIAARGWTKVADNPDVHVVLHGATQTKRNANTFYSGMGGYGAYGWGGWGGTGTASTVVNEYKVGTLIVDIFDAKSKGLVFRGTAEDEISDNAERNQKRIEKASTKMFKDFPPMPKTK
jgi:Domain of unknown function (DUF4136)